MDRLATVMFAGAISLALAAPGHAGTSLLGPGYANWFYACGGSQTMNLAIRHADGTMTDFSLGPGQRTRGPVARRDQVAWRCGGPIAPGARFIFIATDP